jgi:NADH-quinone oxidoreductase subunit A
MEQFVPPILPILLFVLCVIGLAVGLLAFARIVRPGRPGAVTRMPYESGMDPIHDTRRRFDVRFYLLAIAFLVVDVELLFLYPWAVFAGGMGTSAPIRGPIRSDTEQSTAEDERAEDKETRRQRDEQAANRRTSRDLLVSQSRSVPVSLSPPLRSSSAMNNHHLAFAAVMIFVALLTLGFVYDWRKGVFQWR